MGIHPVYFVISFGAWIDFRRYNLTYIDISLYMFSSDFVFLCSVNALITCCFLTSCKFTFYVFICAIFT